MKKFLLAAGMIIFVMAPSFAQDNAAADNANPPSDDGVYYGYLSSPYPQPQQGYDDGGAAQQQAYYPPQNPPAPTPPLNFRMGIDIKGANAARRSSLNQLADDIGTDNTGSRFTLGGDIFWEYALANSTWFGFKLGVESMGADKIEFSDYYGDYDIETKGLAFPLTVYLKETLWNRLGFWAGGGVSIAGADLINGPVRDREIKAYPHFDFGGEAYLSGKVSLGLNFRYAPSAKFSFYDDGVGPQTVDFSGWSTALNLRFYLAP